IRSDVNPEFRADAALGVLVYAVAESVAGHVRRRPAGGKRRGRPEMSALFITDVIGLATAIAHRIVVPGRETQLVRILAPGVAQTALRDDSAELRIGENVRPGDRRHLG